LAIFTIHSRGPDLDAIADARFLRDGFAWGAFWLGPFWLLRHGLYAACVASVVAMVILAIAASSILAPAAAACAFLALQVLLGLEADPLRQGKLADAGYRLVDIIAAKNLDEAEIAFFGRHGAVSTGGFPDTEARP
jgi:hypothetical protein